MTLNNIDTSWLLIGMALGFMGSICAKVLFDYIKQECLPLELSQDVNVDVDNLVFHFAWPHPTECLICLETITAHQVVGECIRCNQPLGHIDCISDWMHVRNACPHCQEPLLAGNDRCLLRNIYRRGEPRGEAHGE